MNRIEREKETASAMIRIYCKDHHEPKSGLCPDCTQMQEYALQRLDKCPYRNGKPACINCPTHCYKPDMRENVKSIMRYAGPRMIWRHPYYAIWHIIDKFKKTESVHER